MAPTAVQITDSNLHGMFLISLALFHHFFSVFFLIQDSSMFRVEINFLAKSLVTGR